MLDITRKNIVEYTGKRLIVALKESLASCSDSPTGYSGISGFSGVSQTGLLKLQKKTIDRLTCVRIEEFSASGEYIRVKTLSSWNGADRQEEWYDIIDFVYSYDFLDVV